MLRPLAVAWVGSFLTLLGPISAGAYRNAALTIGLILAIGVAVYLLTMRDALVRRERNMALLAAVLIGALAFLTSSVGGTNALDARVSNFLLSVPLV